MPEHAEDRPGQPGFTFALLDLAIMFGYALLGARAIRLLKQSGARWLERACGGMLIGLAGSLALYRRHAA